MSEKDKIKQQIESLQNQVDTHRAKIASKKKPYYPYEEGEIQHWEAEIRAFEAQIEKLQSKL